MHILRALFAMAIVATPVLAQTKGQDKVDLTGKWDLTAMSQGETGAAEVTLIQRGDSLIGRYAHKTLGDLEVVGNVKGRDFAFVFNAPFNGQQLPMNIKGVAQTPDSLTGTATMGPLGSATFFAKRRR